MKFDLISKSAALALISASLASFSACSGGGGGSTTAAGTVYPSTVYDYTAGDYLVNIGGSTYQDESDGDILNNEGGNTYYNESEGGYEYADSKTTGASKDTDLQKANAQKADVTARAQTIANRFQMSVQASVQLVQLSDRVKQMSTVGAMSDSDRVAVTNAGLAVAGVTPDQVNQAIQKGLNGDDSAAEAMLSKAAKNLGMPSASNLRDQLLPALGVTIQ
jgi:hypothetical protein